MKTKVISIMNSKGGVGKTITAANMAQILASEYGHHVLAIDLDPQADLTALTETPVATTSAVGGIKAQSGSSDGQNFPVQVNSDGSAFINIPIYNGEVE